MPEHGFSLTRDFTYKDSKKRTLKSTIVKRTLKTSQCKPQDFQSKFDHFSDFVYIRENTDQRKPVA